MDDLLELKEIEVVLEGKRIIKELSFSIPRGAFLPLVGPSGSGKSLLAKVMAGLIEPTAGQLFYKGAPLPFRRPMALRREIQLIFQDPYSALNPKMRVGAILAEPLIVHGIEKSESGRRSVVEGLLKAVGLAPSAAERYPRHFSGGERQRIAIARALAAGPEFLICDEALSSLDADLQMTLLELLFALRRDRGLTILLITHQLHLTRAPGMAPPLVLSPQGGR